MTDTTPNDAQPPLPTPAAADDERTQAPARTAPTWAAPPTRRLHRTDAWLMLGLAVVALAIHLVRLGAPGAVLPSTHESCQKLPPLEGQTCYQLIPLDEVHYVPDARDVLRYGTDSDVRIPDGDGQSGRFVVHPPVGKWFIAAGIWLFGDQPFGWRFFGAIFGSLGSIVTYLIARRLWAARWAAVLAGGLLAIEGLWFVQSRVAMLDIYTAVFFLTGTWLLLEDRDRTGPEHRGARWWRIGAATSFGFAVATKWSVVPLVAIVVGMAFAWELARIWRHTPRGLLSRLVAFVGTFLLLPVTLYVATYTPWMIDAQRYSPGDCNQNTIVLGELFCYHQQMVGFHRNLEKYESVPATDETEATVKPNHPYFGEAWSWPWIGRPVAHHFETIGEGPDQRLSEVLGLPNPLIWVPAFLALLPLLWWTIRWGDQVAPLLFGVVAAGWLPYLLADIVDRPVFLFYATPIVPFLVMGIVHVWVRLVHRWEGARVAAGIFGGVALLSFAYFYPVIAAHPIPREGPLGWESRMWLNGPVSDCLVSDQVKIRCWI